MAAPSLVGVTHIDPSVSWESGGHTITSADRPAGTRRGDRLILFIAGGKDDYSTNTPALWDLGGDWTAQTLRAPAGTGFRPFIAAWTARYTAASVLSQTLVPKTSGGTTITSSNASDNWQAFLLAYRPSHVVGGTDDTLSFSADHLMPGSAPATALTITNPVDGINIACATFSSFAATCQFNGGTGYTEIANYAPSSGTKRRQGVSLIDRDAGSTEPGGSSTPIEWEKNPFAFGFTGVAAMVALTETADPPMADSGWSVGFLKF